MTAQSQHQAVQKRTVRDLAIAVFGAAGCSAFFILTEAFCFFERILGFLQSDHEHYVVIVLASCSLWGAWFGWRQWRAAEKQVKALAHAERALYRSHDEMDFMAAAAPGAFYVRDGSETGAIVHIGAKVEEQFGYTPDDFRSDPFFLLQRIHPDDREAYLSAQDAISVVGETKVEYRFCHADGSYRWVEDHTVLLKDDRGRPEALVGYLHDNSVQRQFREELEAAVSARTAELSAVNRALEQEIAERQATAAKLKLEEDRTMRLLANLPGFVYVRENNAAQCIHFISEGVERVLGYAPSELTCKGTVNLRDLVHPEDRDIALSANAAALAPGETYRCEYRIRTAAGEERWVWERMYGVFGEDGQLLRIESYVTDITERKEMEEALRTSRDHLDIVTNNLPFAVSYVDCEERLLSANKTFEDWLGQPLEEMIGKPLTEIVTRKTYAAMSPLIKEVLQGRRASAEGHGDYADGSSRTVHRDYVPNVAPDGQPDGFIMIVRDITEQKLAEKERWLNEERLTQAAEIAEIGYYVWDAIADGCIFCSEEHARLHDLSPEEYIARAAKMDEEFSLTHPDDRALVKRQMQALRAGGKVDFEYRVLLADGTSRHVREIVRPIFDEDGRVIQEIGTSQDITAAKLAQQSLEERERRLRAAARMAKLGHYAFDVEKDRYTFCSTECARIHGMTVEEYMATSATSNDDVQWVHPDDRQLYLDEMGEALEQLRPFSLEYRLIGKDGVERYVRDVEHSVEVEDGRIVRTEGTLQDISDMQQAEDSLAESERRLRSAAQMAKLGHYVWDLVEDRCIYCSEELARLHGLSVTDYLQSAMSVSAECQTFVHPDDLDRYREALERSLEERQPLNIEYRIIGENGIVRHVREIEHAMYFEDGIPVRTEGTVQDITETKLAEERLQQSQKMDAIGQLTGGVAHDFNNLLTVVLGNLQLIERRVKDDERLTKRVETAIHAAQRGAELTKSLLAFSRRQRLDSKVISLNDAVSQMQHLLRTSVSEQIELRLDLTEGLRQTSVDPAQLESALLNLVINARDAMPEGGRILIETQNADLDQSYADKQPDVQAGPYVMLSVTDSGTGMSPEVQKHVFEPFFTTKEVGKGTGLGLSMVFGFIKQSGGHVALYSEEGAGTSFKLFLPAVEAEGGEAADHSASLDCPGGDETILVVEDQEEVRKTSLAILEELGYHVLSAGNGPSALELINNLQTEIDLLFTDIVMPQGMNGLELAVKAREVRPDLKVLYTSGFSEAALQDQGSDERERDWLAKPFFNHTLAQKVREVLDRSQSAGVK